VDIAVIWAIVYIDITAACLALYDEKFYLRFSRESRKIGTPLGKITSGTRLHSSVQPSYRLQIAI
jgi:hypothetical protein